MKKESVLVILLIAILIGCASDKGKPKSLPTSQDTTTIKDTNTKSTEGRSARNREVQDGQVMDLSKIDNTEKEGWIDPKNPPEMKRKYHAGYFSIILPDDLYPVKTSVYNSGGLFKFLNRDAYMYIFAPQGVESTAFLDINLNTLDLIPEKGYHDMLIDLKGNVLKMTYSSDVSSDGYTRYVDINKTYKPERMLVSALIMKDSQGKAELQQEYESVLKTLTQDAK